MTITEYLVVFLLVVGLFFSSVAAIGIIRLPDLYARAHSASKSDTLGAVLTLSAVAFVYGWGVPSIKTLLLVVFMFLTNPTAVHAITRAANDQGIEPWTIDEEPQGEKEQ